MLFFDSIQVCVIEDEFHFLLICPLFNEVRDNYVRNVITDCTFIIFGEFLCSNNISVLLIILSFVKIWRAKATRMAKYVLVVLN